MEFAVVIHAEEEFDWDQPLNRKNTTVTHHKELVTTVESLISLGAKVTLMLDYAFISDAKGKEAIHHLVSLNSSQLEFGSHLHPWINPPFENDDNFENTSNLHSFPGNLEEHIERNKLAFLTKEITRLTKVTPKTYLAGRYGIGKNSYKILRDLGYKNDISPCSYCDFRYIDGPDFSLTTNKHYSENGIRVFPHTNAIISKSPTFSKYLNKVPKSYQTANQSFIAKTILKLLRVKKLRFSTEGISTKELKQVASTLIHTEQNEVILSLHSSSLKLGQLPYSHLQDAEADISKKTINFVQWMLNQKGVEPALVSDFKGKD